jgi:thioredoxin
MENLTAETFKEKVYDFTKSDEPIFKGTKPALIDCYTTWCAPCKTIAPVLEELSWEYTNIDFYKVDVEEEDDLSKLLEIRNVPTIFLIPMTGEPKKLIGAMSKEEFAKAINEVLNAD